MSEIPVSSSGRVLRPAPDVSSAPVRLPEAQVRGAAASTDGMAAPRPSLHQTPKPRALDGLAPKQTSTSQWPTIDPHVAGLESLVDTDPSAVLRQLTSSPEPAEALVGARAALRLGHSERALELLNTAEADPVLNEATARLRAELALRSGDPAEALRALSSVETSFATPAQLPIELASRAAREDPELWRGRLSQLETLYTKLIDEDLGPARTSQLMRDHATILEALGERSQARDIRLQQYLTLPATAAAPTSAPSGTAPTPSQRLSRAERLLSQQHSAPALEEFEALYALAAANPNALQHEEVMRVRYGIALAMRKLRRYGAQSYPVIKAHLEAVLAQTQNPDLARRAAYLRARVGSIKSDPQLVQMAEEFAVRFAGHSMVDDVLFWAADYLHGSVGDLEAAIAMYRRAAALNGDFGDESRWRIAWVAKSAGDLPAAREAFRDIAAHRSSSPESKSRAHYWLAEIAQTPTEAVTAYQSTFAAHPLGFYALIAFSRLETLDVNAARELDTRWTAPPPGGTPSYPAGPLASEPAYQRGVALMRRGLTDEAGRVLASIADPSNRDASIHLALLLSEVGKRAEAQRRLRGRHRAVLLLAPSAKTGPVWHAAYPLAYEAELTQAAERYLPATVTKHLMFAFAREESAFTPTARSWAGALGLIQIMPTTARAVVKRHPELTYDGNLEDALLTASFNARVSAALINDELRSARGHPALAIAAYNAGATNTRRWWKKHPGGDLATFTEAIGISETRNYVKRVLGTYGLYRWLHGGQRPTVPASTTLPHPNVKKLPPASETDTPGNDPRFSALMSVAKREDLANRPAADGVVTLGIQLIGSPYRADTLEGPDGIEQLRTRLDAFDCVTFVETALAMTRAVRAGGEQHSDFRAEIEGLRYRRGELVDYASRLHYFYDWLRDNESRGTVRNITSEIGGDEVSKSLNFMSSHREAYPALEDPSVYEQIRAVEASLPKTMKVIGQRDIAAAIEHIRPGDIIATTTDVDGLDVSHVGIAVRNADGGIGFLHASRHNGVTIAADLATYVLSKPHQTGILVARPN